jgi:hypothetical protein
LVRPLFHQALSELSLIFFLAGFMQNMVGVNPDNQLMAPNGGPSALGAQYIY